MKCRRSIFPRSSALCGRPGPPLLATTAAEPVFSCRCGSPGTGRPLREALPEAPRSSAPCHNGSGTRIFLPLRKPRNRPVLARGASRGTPVLRSCHNGSGTRIFLPLRKPRNRPTPAGGASRGTSVLRPIPQRQRNPYFPAVAEVQGLADPCGRCFPRHPGPPLLATTAAKPAFSCRCGSPGTGRPLREVLLGAPQSSAPFHNGSGTGIFLPLWKYGTYILSLYILGMRQYAENE